MYFDSLQELLKIRCHAACVIFFIFFFLLSILMIVLRIDDLAAVRCDHLIAFLVLFPCLEPSR